MSEVHQLPDKEASERQASEWIARLNADDVSSDDLIRFEAWRKAHPLHARTYEELAATWRRVTAAGPMVRAVSWAQDINEISSIHPSRRRWIYAVAATLIFAVIGGWYTLRTPEVVYRTAVGQYSVVTLPDGSTLELNTASIARVQYSRRARVIRLEQGEAFFQVAHNAARPFWVVVGDSWIRDVGTAFDVRRRDTGAEVTVSEGVVKVGHDSLSPRDLYSKPIGDLHAAELRAGQQADIHQGATSIRTLSAEEIARFIAWRGGTVYFEDQPLSEVVSELARYTKLRLVVEDNDLRNLRIGGTFQASEAGIQSFLKMLKDGLAINVRRDADHVYIDGTADADVPAVQSAARSFRQKGDPAKR